MGWGTLTQTGLEPKKVLKDKPTVDRTFSLNFYSMEDGLGSLEPSVGNKLGRRGKLLRGQGRPGDPECGTQPLTGPYFQKGRQLMGVGSLH